MFGEKISFRHGTFPCPEAVCSAPFSNASSALFTLLWSLGLSRYHQKKTSAQTTPSAPKNSKVCRQVMKLYMYTTRIGVNAPPQRELIQVMPCARTRSS